ncbi:hypothetical protein AVEN_141241-1 [Araneus ventricosus]|uniref:DUF4218 domain-containing protein n=1 Tax=Araneus ventricosus TaxID=182803 RepID=A0A4Y2SVF5_ARAVE|nr:hypothetical protein AVEN_141241-1 [Araneus ventricosus]
MNLEFNNLIVNSKFTIKLLIHNQQFKLIARSFVKGIKQFNAKFVCEKCTQRRSTINGSINFLNINSPLRSDADFRGFVQEEHYTGVTPLLKIKDLGLVLQFPFDWMHLVDLGVTKKLILYWSRNGERTKINSARISQRQIRQISENLLDFRSSMPSEFKRKPRSLKDIDRWKAIELKQFLLYLGPIVLENILPENLFEHFLCLHASMAVLSNAVLCKEEECIVFAEKMLKSFVENIEIFYGEASIVYNVPNLLHISNDVRRHGNINGFSCYPFEEFLGQMKNMMRKRNHDLSQLIKRLSEQTKCFKYDRMIALARRKKYAIVSFLDEGNAAEVIPTKWILRDEKAKWPNFSSLNLIGRCIQERCAPSENWSTVKIKIYGYSNSFKKAKSKASNAQDTSEEEIRSHKRKVSRKYNSSDMEEEITTINKRKKLHRIPTTPQIKDSLLNMTPIASEIQMAFDSGAAVSSETPSQSFTSPTPLGMTFGFKSVYFFLPNKLDAC